MAKLSAGILVVRHLSTDPEFLLVHPGGPLWKSRDAGAWSIPKGEYLLGEDPLEAALREFGEELGVSVPDGLLLSLGTIRQAGGKQVSAWSVVGDVDTALVVSNSFEMQWPPKSGRMQQFPEIDRAEFFSLSAAADKLLAAQIPFLERALAALRTPPL